MPGNPVAKVLLVIAVACLVAGLFPGRNKYTDGETDENVTEWRIGLKPSPLWAYQHRESPTGFKSEGGFHLFSLSTVLVAVGIGCLQHRHRINSLSASSDSGPCED